MSQRLSKKVAIVGMAHRLPGGEGDLFWKRLVAGEDLVTEVAEGRWAKEKFLHPRKSEPGSSYTFAAGSVPNATGFDPAFFGISPREAIQMDPQQRLLMELTWEALEDAGVKPSSLKGSRCGVFVGISSFDYAHRLADDLSSIDSKTPTGNAGSIAANRISYFLDARGPSFVVDTACSSSLVAFHQAWNSLLTGESSCALVGGVSLHFHPLGFLTFTKTGMLSCDGRCRTFDADADGYVRSEGGGMVLLKPLDQAIADGDRILAVVEGSGINCDGRTPGITVPSGEAQAALLREVYAASEVDPQSLDFIEAHGTGTSVGDPIETWAIGEVLGKSRGKDRPLWMGSVKSNLGHLEAASGMAGLMKVLLSFRHRMLPPNLYFNKPNPRIDFEDLNLRVVTEAMALDAAKPLYAGINSFGFGGANAHLILSVPPCEAAVPSRKSSTIELPMVFSARSTSALRDQAAQLAEFLESDPSLPLYDTFKALHDRRDKLSVRAGLWATERSDFIANLRQFAASSEVSNVVTAEAYPAWQAPVFVFTGNGAQWEAMGRTLFAENQVFRNAIEKVDALFKEVAPFSLQPHFQGETIAEGLQNTEIAQPLIFSIQVGLVECLAANGIQAAAVLGHSLGEVAAAWASGKLSLDQAVRVIRLRSFHQQSTFKTGSMTAVAASRSDVESILKELPLRQGGVFISGENSHRSVTLAADMDALEECENALTASGIKFKRLDLDYPFHSPKMDPVVELFLKNAGKISDASGILPFYSTVSGDLSTTELNEKYWSQNIREPVLFYQAISAAARDGHQIFLEIGPHPVLTNHIAAICQELRLPCRAESLITRESASANDLQTSFRRLILGGVHYDWGKYFEQPASRFVHLPHYPWQREEYLLPLSPEGSGHLTRGRQHLLLGYPVSENEWENHIDTAWAPWLADHKVGDSVVFPAAAFVEMALAASSLKHPARSVQIEDFEIRTPLVLSAKQSKTIRFVLQENRFLIKSRERMSEDAWQPHVSGTLSSHIYPDHKSGGNNVATHDDWILGNKIYQTARILGLEYGPFFQSLRQVQHSDGWISALLAPKFPDEAPLEKFHLHPLIFDGALQSLLALSSEASESNWRDAFLPVRIERLHLLRHGALITESRAFLRRHSTRSLLADFFLYDEAGGLCAIAKGVRLKAARLVKNSMEKPRMLSQRWVSRARPSSSSFIAGRLDLIEGALKESLRSWPDQSLLKRFPLEGDALLDALISAISLEALLPLADSESVVDIPQCLSHGILKDSMEPYFRRLVKTLVEDGMAEPLPSGDAWRILKDEEFPPARDIWRSLVADFPETIQRVSIVGRVGLHMDQILQGTYSIEEFLPKNSRLTNGGIALERSSVMVPMQRVLGEALEKIFNLRGNSSCSILWMTGARPMLEEFLFPWVQNSPGIFTVVLPDSQETLDVAERLSAYPGVNVLKFNSVSELVASTSDEEYQFDMIVTQDLLSEEANRALAGLLLDGGVFLGFLPEASRFSDFIPVSEEGGLPRTRDVESSLKTCFNQVHRIFVLEDFKSGPAFFAACNCRLRLSTKVNAPVKSLLIPFDESAMVLGETLVPLIGGAENAVCELLPPADFEANLLWERLLQDHNPDHLIFFTPMGGRNKLRSAESVSNEISAITATLRVCFTRNLQPTIVIVTHGAMAESGAMDWVSSALWGFARVARNEFSQFRIRCIDLAAELISPEIIEELAAEISVIDNEDEVIIGGSSRRVARVHTFDASPSDNITPNNKSFLDFSSPGSFNNLHWKRSNILPPSYGEIAVEVRAAGLNFRDVMYAMGLLPDEALEDGFAGPTLGMELSGVVSAIGPDVDKFRVGDEVIAFSPASFANRAVTSQLAVMHKPVELSFEAAATIPAAFFTVYHSLVELAALQSGERILIHGGAGGVGIAAIQIAKQIGAEIFATAGNQEKRDFVKLLGADHVFDSRSLDFADQILELTHGEGIDVVLNSLAGEAVTRNLEILRPFGRFIELGKRDFYENNRVGLRSFRHNIRYFAVDADQIMALRPDLAAGSFSRLMEMFQNRALAPLPMTVFPAASAAEAFRYMQHSKQIGKVVIRMNDIPEPVNNSLSPIQKPTIQSYGTYIITGGSSGFGLQTAKFLIDCGAKTLVLVSRRGQCDDTLFIELCHSQGVTLSIEVCDVSDEKSVNHLLTATRKKLPPIRGIFHAAMVLNDGLILNIQPDQVRDVIIPKISGALFFDQFTREDPIEHFILYSSATTFFGNPGQAAYVAANTALEELAAKRLAEGLPATCVAWGPIGDTGYLSKHQNVKDALASRIGGHPLESSDAVRFLGNAMACKLSQVAWLDFDWSTMSRFLPDSGNPRFSMLQHLAIASSQNTDASKDLRLELDRLNDTELLQTLKALLKDEISAILRVPPDKLDENRSLLEIGMDSLMGVELMTSLENSLGITIPLMAFSEAPTMARLSEKLFQIIRPTDRVEENLENQLDPQMRQILTQHGESEEAVTPELSRE